MWLEKKIWQGPHSLTFKTHRMLSFQGKEQCPLESSSTLNGPVTCIPKDTNREHSFDKADLKSLIFFQCVFNVLRNTYEIIRGFCGFFFFLLYFWLWCGFKFHGSPLDFIRLRTAGWKIQHCSFNKQSLKKQKENRVLSDIQTKTKQTNKQKASDKCYNFKTGFKTKDHDYSCKEIGRHRG